MAKSQLGFIESLKAQRLNIEQICEQSGVAGLSITLIHQGETVFQDSLGYRDVDKQEPVTSDTIFHIASLTKSFTGACIDRLRAQGKLAFDDPIQKHLPEAKSRDACVAEGATIADLLGHRTGLQRANKILLGASNELLINKDQTVCIFNRLQPQTSLRSSFRYNNICYALLGEIIER